MEHRLVKHHEAHHHHGINKRIAVSVTRGVGTMWCAYAFAVLSLISAPAAISAFLNGDILAGVGWLSQTFFQLVLLPVIIVGQNVQAQAQDMRAEADHETLNEILRRLDGQHQENRN